jgi:hypothetical protein
MTLERRSGLLCATVPKRPERTRVYLKRFELGFDRRSETGRYNLQLHLDQVIAQRRDGGMGF